MEIKRYARRSDRGTRTLLSDKGRAEWGWGEKRRDEAEERFGDILSSSVQNVPDPYDGIPYNYTINLSLDDLVEIIGVLSRNAVYKSRPALQKALEPHISKLLAITLAASDYPSPGDDTEAIPQDGDDTLGRMERRDAFSVITQDGDDTLIDLRAHGSGTVRLKNFSVYGLDGGWDESFVDIYSVITRSGNDTLINLRDFHGGTIRLKNFFAHDDLLHGEDFVFDKATEEPDDM